MTRRLGSLTGMMKSPVNVAPCRFLGLVSTLLVICVGCSTPTSESAVRDLSVSPASTPPDIAAPPQADTLQIIDGTYVVPALDGSEERHRGHVLAVDDQPPTADLGNAVRRRFLYTSIDRQSNPVVVSGLSLVPDRPAPQGGWPIVSWGHGTTGVADVCSPSMTDNLFYNEYAQEARTYLNAGYAVVATDYPGLGTPGIHPYLDGVGEANAMVDAVVAARELDPTLSARFFAVGHSQGGGAALFATRAVYDESELELAGAVAIAPSSGNKVSLPAIVGGLVPSDVVYGVYLLAGLSTVDSDVDVEELLGAEGRKRADVLLRNGCLLDALPLLSGVAPDLIFSITDEELTRYSETIASYADAENEPLVGDVLIVQGETDHDIPVVLTNQLVKRLAELGSPAEYRVYPGLGHDQVIGPSVCDRLAWMTRHGGPKYERCEPYETDLS